MVVNKFMRMNGNNILLDTNIISALLKGESRIADRIDKAPIIYIPVFVIGELYFGAMHSTQIQKNINDIKKLTATYVILLPDIKTAGIYGKIKTVLRKKGKPIPENDIWIAAIAKQYNLALATRDKHFKEINELSIKSW